MISRFRIFYPEKENKHNINFQIICADCKFEVNMFFSGQMIYSD